jgi:hypothetical protein
MAGRDNLERRFAPPWTSDGPWTVHLALPTVSLTLCGKDRQSLPKELDLSEGEAVECEKCLAWANDLD